MKTTAIVLAVLTLFACGTGALLAQGPEDGKFKKFQDSFWDAYFKFYPTSGTIQGYAKYRDKLEDPSQAGLEKFNEILEGFRPELIAKIDKTKLSADNQVEHEMYLDFIELERLKLQIDGPWEMNPLLYNELFVQSLRSVLVKNGAAGIAPATARARLIPGLVKRAKDNLKNPPREYTQAAIDQMPTIIDFYRVEVPKLSGGDAALQAETVKAAAALEDHLRFMRSDLLPKSTGSFRLGQDHQQILQMTTQGFLAINAVIGPQAKADLSNIRRDMSLVCIPFYKIMYPHIDIEKVGAGMSPEQIQNVIIKGVLDKIKVDHVGREEFIALITKSAADIKAFVQKRGLINLPQESLAIEPMPAYCADGSWTRLMTPGAFETTGPYTMLIRPIPAAWSDEEATSFLEEHNDAYIDAMTIQRIFPGPFVPTALSRKDPSLIKRIAPNQGLLKGWPIFLEDMFIENGYGDFDLRMRLGQLKLMLKNVIDFQVDMLVHEGAMTRDEAIGYMMSWGFMTKPEAERRWNQIILNPGEAAQAYIGYQEILNMERDYQRLKGEAFNVREFLEKLVSHGAISFRTLRTRIVK